MNIKKIAFLLPNNPVFYSAAESNRWLTYINAFSSYGIESRIIVLNGYISKDEKKSKSTNCLKTVYICKNRLYNKIYRKIYKLVGFVFTIDRLRLKRLKKCLSKDNPDCIFIGRNSIMTFDFSEIVFSEEYNFILELSEFEDISQPKSIIKSFEHNKALKRFYSTLEHITLFTIMTKTLCRHYYALTHNKGNIIHIPMTVDLSRFDQSKLKPAAISGLPSSYIAYCGSLSNKKDGIDILIKSFSVFHNFFPQYHLCLAGANHPDVEGQNRLIESLGVRDFVHYLGVIHQFDIPSFLCNASILALSRPKSHQAEGGFPTKLGEYLATGNPVCVTKTGEIADYLQNGINAFLAEPDDIKSFTDALCRAASDMNNAEDVGKKGRHVAETEFNMNIHIKRLLNKLETIP